MHRGVAQHGLAHLLGVQEAAGSNPVAPIFSITGAHVAPSTAKLSEPPLLAAEAADETPSASLCS